MAGTPTSYGSLDGASSGRVTDLNGDGRNDLVVEHSSWGAISVYLQRSDGRLGPEARYTVRGCCGGILDVPGVGDLNNDRRPDIAVAVGDENLAILYGRR